MQVEDPAKQVLHTNSGSATGQFVFTTKLAGEYKACFTQQAYQDAIATRIKLDWKTGVETNDWDSIAKKEHLDAVSLELRKMEESMRAVYDEMLLLQDKELAMREMSGEHCRLTAECNLCLCTLPRSKPAHFIQMHACIHERICAGSPACMPGEPTCSSIIQRAER